MSWCSELAGAGWLGPVSREERAARLALTSLPAVGAWAFVRLMVAFGSATAALAAGPDVWAACLAESSGRWEEMGRRLSSRPKAPRLGEDLLQAAEGLGFSVLTLGEPEYPDLLYRTPSPPPVLYVKGALLPSDWRSVAVVGTRRATTYGRWAAGRLAEELVAEGFTVVSGLARGIDEAAHRAALKTGGRTVAVLGCGPDLVYPPENTRLAEQITSAGAVITEFPPGTAAVPTNFPRRNRIIAGLSLGVVVVEAGERSGALNTVGHALEAGREVFAVPGDLGRPSSAGTNALLRSGATFLVRGSQVVENLPYLRGNGLRFGPPWRLGPVSGLDRWEAEVRAGLADPAHAVWRSLGEGPALPEELATRTGMPVAKVLAQLVLWELDGKISAHPDGRVTRLP